MKYVVHYNMYFVDIESESYRQTDIESPNITKWTVWEP